MKTSLLYLAAALAIIIGAVFYFFPLMGHDYSMFLSALNDYHFAWHNFSVFHLDFTPQRCLGVPVWANPIGANYSIFHILSLYLNDLSVLVTYIIMIISLSFWGVLKLQELLNTNKNLRNYFAFAWCLQGYIVSRVVVGHVPFITLGLWPLYAYILLKPAENRKQFWISTLIFTLFYTLDFYSGNTYLFVMFPIGFVLFCLLLRFNEIQINLKEIFKKYFSASLITGLLILPKVVAVISYTRNFIRGYSFTDISFIKGIEYSILSILFPVTLNYNQMTGWGYGNWEAINFLFPGLLIFILATSLLNLKTEKKIFISLFGLILVGAFIASGIYSDFVLLLPVVKSLHVNPRWMPIINLSILGISLIYCTRKELPSWAKYFLLFLAVFPNIYMLDIQDLQIMYPYHRGYIEATNRVSFCYEPVFGYRLELMPRKDAPAGRYFDPRCYLGNAKCTDYLLPKELEKDLESYQLRPFKN